MDSISVMEKDFMSTTITTEQELEMLMDKYTDDEIELYTYKRFNEQMDKRGFIEYMKLQSGLVRRINS